MKSFNLNLTLQLFVLTSLKDSGKTFGHGVKLFPWENPDRHSNAPTGQCEGPLGNFLEQTLGCKIMGAGAPSVFNLRFNF